jgi:hypothetical protein
MDLNTALGSGCCSLSHRSPRDRRARGRLLAASLAQHDRQGEKVGRRRNGSRGGSEAPFRRLKRREGQLGEAEVGVAARQ